MITRFFYYEIFVHNIKHGVNTDSLHAIDYVWIPHNEKFIVI